MADRNLPLNRRELLAGFGATVLSPTISRSAVAQTRPRLLLEASPGAASFRPGAPDTPIWSLLAPSSTSLRFKRGDSLEVALETRLPVPALMTWRGIDGVPAAEPLAARPP